MFRQATVYMHLLLLFVFLQFQHTPAASKEKPICVESLRLFIIDKYEKEPLVYVPCVFYPLGKADSETFVVITDSEGACNLKNLPVGDYGLEVCYMGQASKRMTVSITPQTVGDRTVYVDVNPIQIGDAVVVASESKGLSTSSKIGQEALRHIQPSSIGDLLELLPGGRAKDPAFGSPQVIRIREASPVSTYNTSSLGTQFLIDGIPVSNDANMQKTPAYSAYGSSFVNSGVDMRTIGTDNIESVEIVRGIPSAEYGDLTSGLVKIQRKKGGDAMCLRFKADMTSKLFSAGKAFQPSKAKGLSINADLDYLDARSDPRNVRQNYKRATASLRAEKKWGDGSSYAWTLGGNVDFTGSFDQRKSDKDLDVGDNGPIERYKSSYNRFVFGTHFRVNAIEERFFCSASLTAALTSEKDFIDRWKYVTLSTATPLSTTLDEGEHDATVVPNRYNATLKVEGKPFYAYVNATSLFKTACSHTKQEFKVGLNWTMDKNYGRGTVFDPTHPFSVDMNVRPRSFNSIPAKHQISAFLENDATITWRDFTLRWMAGVRAMEMLNISYPYALRGKVELDPRLNLRLIFPGFDFAGRKLRLETGAGAGWHTKCPTLYQLYPDLIYYDITQLNYWPPDESKRRINVAVFKIDPVHFDLGAARNFKCEVRENIVWNGFELSVTYFEEDMKSGFRSSSKPIRFVYKNYDEQAIDYHSLTGPPSLETTPYSIDTLLTTHSLTTNGSRTRKKGVEFTFSSPRIRSLHTKFSVSGAWFLTTYSNSQPEYYRPSVVIDNSAYPYIGYYKDEDNYLREMFNTNFGFDTQIPNMGLIFSCSFQCLWYTGSQNKRKDPNPLAYIDKNLRYHIFTEESARNGVLSEMVRSYNKISFIYSKVPFCLNVNMKVTKMLYHDKIALAIFANRILDYNPSYYSPLGVKVRREVNPYFGMELNFKL